MKVLVGFPPTQSPLGTPLLSQNRQFQYFEKPTFLYPVVLGTAATMAKKAGHEVLWEDAIAQNMDWRAYDEMLSREKPDIFLFETKAPVVKKHWEAINHIKNKFPNIKIVICGDHVSYLPGETLENSEVDYVINGGYFDFAFMELVEWLDGNKETKVPNGIWHRNKKNEIVENGRYFLKNNLDDAPFPDRKLTKYMDYQDEFNLKGRPQFYIMSARDCAWGKCTFCFHPEMDVVTKEGIKLIKDIKVGEEVLTYDGSYYKTDFMFEREYDGEMIHIEVSNLPRKIKCTPNHKLFVVKNGKDEPEFIEASQLKIGDSLTFPIIREVENINEIDVFSIINESFTAISTKVKTLSNGMVQEIQTLHNKGISKSSIANQLKVNVETITSYLNNESKGKILLEKNENNVRFKYGQTSIPSKIPLNKEFMRLAGYYLAEGNVSFRSERPNSGTLQLTFHKDEVEYIEDVKNLIKKLFSLDSILTENKTNNTIQVTVYSNILAHLFKNLFNEGSLKKDIPSIFMRLPLEKQKELIKGLLKGDGHLRKRKKGWEYTLNTVSKKLAYKTWMILTRFEIVPSFYVAKKETRARAKYDQYVLSICGADLNKLGFVDFKLKNPKKSIRNVFIRDDNILFKINEISRELYNGKVYNMSVPGNRTYNTGLISVSNCVWDHALYPKGSYKQRSPENTFEEVKHLVDDLGAREIFDDAGTIPPGLWLKKFCELMISSGYNKKVMYSCNMRFGWVDADMYKLMKKAGFRLLKFGLESGCQKTIDKLDKGTDVSLVHQHCKDAKDAGLTVHITMMVGYPWETKEDAMKTFNLAKDLMHKGLVDIHQSTVVMPYPGTPLYEEAAREGWLRFEKTDYEKLAMDQPAMKTINMTPEEVQGICKLNYKIYLHPKYVWQHAKSRIKSWEDVKYTWEGFTAVIGHMKDFSRKPELQRDKNELLTKEQVARMNANLHNPRQDLVAIKPGATEPIPYRHIEEVEVEMPLQIVR